jgi:hypothetical protein
LTGIQEFDVQLDNFYRLRSELLDSFSDIERSLLVHLSKNTEKGCCITAPLGHKIEAAKKVAAGPQRSKELKMKADIELSKLALLLPLRADIVHSRMEVAVTSSSRLVAIFRNAKDAKFEHPEALVFEREDLAEFVDRTKTMGKTLDKALTARNTATQSKATAVVQTTPKLQNQPQGKSNPAASPPRPSPDATTGL